MGMRLPKGGVRLPAEAGIVESLVRDRNNKIHQRSSTNNVFYCWEPSYIRDSNFLGFGQLISWGLDTAQLFSQ